MKKSLTQYLFHSLSKPLVVCSMLVVSSFSRAQAPELVMPFPNGVTVSCTQGPEGKYSHRGVRTRHALDFAAPAGTIVVAAADGVVYTFFDNPNPAFATKDCPQATSGGFGNYVTVDHGDGFFTLYSHLRTVDIGNGQDVTGGLTRIGTVNSTGWSCGDHLHFGLLRGSATDISTWAPASIERLLTRQASSSSNVYLAGNEFLCGDTGVRGRYVSVRPPQSVITFDEFEESGSGFITHPNPLILGDIAFSVIGNGVPITPRQGAAQYNGSAALSTAGTGGSAGHQLRIARVDGQPFNLSSIDIDGPFGGLLDAIVQATFVGGGSSTQSHPIDGVPGNQRLQLNLSNISSVTIVSEFGDFTTLSIDNIDIN